MAEYKHSGRAHARWQNAAPIRAARLRLAQPQKLAIAGSRLNAKPRAPLRRVDGLDVAGWRYKKGEQREMQMHNNRFGRRAGLLFVRRRYSVLRTASWQQQEESPRRARGYYVSCGEVGRPSARPAGPSTGG